MLLSLVFVYLLFKASAAQISISGDQTAEYGGEAGYQCIAADSKGVLQVTWQRLLKDQSLENLATYSMRFGEQVNEPYLGKVIFREASLNSTSIALMNVSWQDESCYICSFNAYPAGSERKKTCLTVQGISAEELTSFPRGEHEGDDEGVEFRCSAIGKPAPTIEWDISSGATRLDQPMTETVENSDHTFNSSRSITLKIPPGWKGHVDCVLNSGMKGHRRKRISFSDNKVNEKGPSQSGTALIISAVILISVITVAAAMMRRRKRLKHNQRDENAV